MDFKQMAMDEYCSEVTAPHPGFVAGGAFWKGGTPCHDGTKSTPFWNVYATQFMYVPCFQFTPVPHCTRYLFTARDCNNQLHTFEAESPSAMLTPIWKDLPEGYVELRVEALEDDGTPWSLVGARTFYRSAPFAGPESYTPKSRSYRECALMAYRFLFRMPTVQYWLKHGVPDPDYELNVYPSKMIAAIILAMIDYAGMDPDNAGNALRLARNAADYLLSISVKAPSPLAGLPPTYSSVFQNKDHNSPVDSDSREDTIMLLYPASVGIAYLRLEESSGDSRYFDAANQIADYYRRTVLENGSWPLVVSISTGERLSINDCSPDGIIDFLEKMYQRTGEEIWKTMMENAHLFRQGNRLDTYNWEGQFEDSPTSASYSNLSYSPAVAMIKYLTRHEKDNPESVRRAEELARFVEDQFVVWGKHAPRNRWRNRYWLSEDRTEWYSPAGVEQYNWYVPIDASTAAAISAMLAVYRVNRNPLLLAKACVLADSVTHMQNPVTGQIPTHWTRKTCREDGGDFWINCMIATASIMLDLANETEPGT